MLLWRCRIYDEFMSFSDTVFLFFLALILFGPKKLPEMARQAGRLLAELRRASNEFKSQIETEIAHLEVEKNKVPSSSPPQGAIASLTANSAASESTAPQPDSSATLAAPVVEASSPTSDASPATEAVVEPDVSTSQASHV